MSNLWIHASEREPAELFHGTVWHFEPGDHILPAEQHKRKTTFPSETDPSYAYATGREDYAWDYAEKAHNSHFQPGMKIHPRVYRVKPLGDVEKDPEQYPDDHPLAGKFRGNWTTDRRSRQGFEVLHEMPIPEHMGEPEDWR